MYKHRVGIRGVLHLLRHGHLKQLTWQEYWVVKEWVLGEWSQARGRGSGSVYSPSVWKIRSLTEALQPHSSPRHLPWVLGITCMEGLSAQLGTGASEQQPQGSEIQCWVGSGCLLRRVKMRMLILCCIRFAKFENLQHKICRSCVVLGGRTSCDSQTLPVFLMLKKLLVPSRYNSRLLCMQESLERTWAAKWEGMGLFLLISTELPLLPSSEKEIRIIRFYLRKAVNWVFYNSNQ